MQGVSVMDKQGARPAGAAAPAQSRKAKASRGARSPEGRHRRRRPDGQRHRPCGGPVGLQGRHQRPREGPLRRGPRRDREEHGPPGLARQDQRGRQGRRPEAHHLCPKFDDFADSDLVIEAATEDEDVKKQDFLGALPEPEARGDAGDQHVLDLDHAACRRHRPARALHRHALHEPGAGDGAGRAHPRDRHRGRDLQHLARLRREPRQDDRRVGGLPRLHRQPHPTADDQRGGLHALRGRRRRRGHRQGHAARREPPDGPAGARRLHRPGYVSLGDAGALRGPGGLQVSPLPAAREVRRGRLARPQDQARLLRLSRRRPGADEVGYIEAVNVGIDPAAVDRLPDNHLSAVIFEDGRFKLMVCETGEVLRKANHNFEQLKEVVGRTNWKSSATSARTRI